MFNKLLDIEYEIILGKKGKETKLHIQFKKSDCYHLLGLQYLTDIYELQHDRELVFNQILNGTIPYTLIEKSKYYEQIRERVNFMIFLEQIFDSNDTIFKYNPKLEQFSLIQADFLMKNFIEQQRIFTFLSKAENEKYFCRSFFPDNEKDYSANQVSWTLLFKKKIFKSEKIEIDLFRHKNFKK